MSSSSPFKTALRDTLCGSLRIEHVGSSVRLGGWVHRRRDLGGLVFITDDARALYDQLRERGVTDFTQEPTDHFYGTDMGVRDPFGNHIRILQQGPATVRREARKEAAKAGA